MTSRLQQGALVRLATWIVLIVISLATGPGCDTPPDAMPSSPVKEGPARPEHRVHKEGSDKPMGYNCASCGEVHHDLPDFGADYPDHYWDVPETEREERVHVTPDTCIIDDEHYFVRGVIEVPVHDHPDDFGFGVWVSQKKENFEIYVNDPDSAEIGPFFGWLCTRINYYEEDTQLMKTKVHFRDGGLRPRIVLEPTDHPLSRAQQEGITLEEAWRIAHHYMEER